MSSAAPRLDLSSGAWWQSDSLAQSTTTSMTSSSSTTTATGIMVTKMDGFTALSPLPLPSSPLITPSVAAPSSFVSLSPDMKPFFPPVSPLSPLSSLLNDQLPSAVASSASASSSSSSSMPSPVVSAPSRAPPVVPIQPLTTSTASSSSAAITATTTTAPSTTKNGRAPRSSVVSIAVPIDSSFLRPQSCLICHSHKVKCDGQRPCGRCTRLQRAHQCCDRVQGQSKVRTRRRSAPAQQKGTVVATIVAADEPGIKPTKRRNTKQQRSEAAANKQQQQQTATAAKSTTKKAAKKNGNGVPQTHQPQPQTPAPATVASIASSSSSSSSAIKSTLPPVVDPYGLLTLTIPIGAPIPDLPPQPIDIASLPPMTPALDDATNGHHHDDDEYYDSDEYEYDDGDDGDDLNADVVPSAADDHVDAADAVDAAPSSSSTTRILNTHTNNNKRRRDPSSPIAIDITSYGAHGSTAMYSTDGTYFMGTEIAFGDPTATPSSDVTAISSHYKKKMMVSLPTGVVVTFDETNVYREALNDLVPWLKTYILNHYQPTGRAADSWIKRMNREIPVRVCPRCTSPSKPCSSCSQPLTTRQNTFTDWFIHSMWASMWMGKKVVMAPAPILETIPIAGFTWSMEPGSHRHETSVLVDHHHRMMQQLSPSSSLADLATAMMPRSTQTSGITTAMMMTQYRMTTPTTTTATTDTKTPVSSSASSSSASAPSDSDSTALIPIGDGVMTLSSRAKMLTVQMLNDMFPVNGPPMVNNHAFVFSMNDELERLLGYSRDEMARRTMAVGWKMNIVFVKPEEALELFQNIFSGIMGIKESWSMRAHVLTKWGSIIKCLVWGSVKHESGFRTCSGFYVPLPSE